ncbi:MAG: flavin reductase [Streptosporangiales bacterium]|nr:flavin reductase [Streptosporangiales bacterium]
MPVTEDVFKDVMGNVPAAVTVVTALDEAGTPVGLTVSAFSVVSLRPPLALVCIDKGSQTLPGVRDGGRFTVNFLADGAEELAIRFASKSPDKFDGVPTRPAPVPGCGPILTGDACGYALCDVVRTVEAGDHWIFVGQVLDAALWRERRPLMYCRRTFSAWHAPEGDGLGSRPAQASGRALGLMMTIEL